MDNQKDSSIQNPIEEKKQEDQRNIQNNANNIRNAADVAIATKNPYAVAAGAAVKGADKLTHGKSTELVGNAMNRANKIMPGGKKIQDLSNRMSESGASNIAGKSASILHSRGGSVNPSSGSQIVSNMPDHNRNVAPVSNIDNQENKKNGGEQKGSLPSSRLEKEDSKKESLDDSSASNESKKGLFNFTGSKMITVAVVIFLPFLLFLLLFVIIIAVASGLFSEYDDAIGMSSTLGDETGGIVYTASSPEQQEFFDRIYSLKQSYQAKGKTVDAMKLVAIYHVLKSNGADLEYKNVSSSVLEEWANAMFDGSMYSEAYFKQNLIDNIIPKYLSNLTDRQKEEIADDIFDYIDQYYSFIGKEANSSSCASAGSCTYDIKGYYIHGKGNVVETIQVNDLYVRLMQCGVGNGHNYGGTFGLPLDGEELVPFEKYILGVAYQEIGPSAPPDAIKAQMVAARSYILARHKDMGGWRTLKQENGKWILQAASCTQDQVYCDPDQGCSATNGQWGQIHSGLGHGSFSRGPMPEDSPLRTYANETAGEVLVNSQGFIIYAGYVQREQNQFTALAKQGLNYKQILLQVYNQGKRNYGASDIQKMSCSTSESSNCISSGEYSTWLQGDPQWGNTPMGNSGKNIHQIGCLVTSVSMLIAKSGVEVNPSISPFNPGTFVEFLNKNGGFSSGGNFNWSAATAAAPSFVYRGKISVAGMSREQKLRRIQELLSQKGVYVVAEVKGNTGQHWVAIDSVSGSVVNMMDPASQSTDMWAQYNWANTSTLAYYQVG